MIAVGRRRARSASRPGNERRPAPRQESGATEIATHLRSVTTESSIAHAASARQPHQTYGCRSCGDPLDVPYVMLPDGGAVHLRCLNGLGAVDEVASRFAEHTDALATLAHQRDDGALVRLALDASAMCSRLHRAYAALHDVAYEGVAQ